MLKQYMEPDQLPGTNWSMEAIDSSITTGLHRLDRFEALCVAMEEVEQIQEDLQTLIDSGDTNQTTAVMMRERIERIEEETGLQANIPSLESHGDDWAAYHQISMEALTGIWNRIKQSYVADWQNIADSFSTIFNGHRRWGLKQQARIHKLRQEWNDKKPELNEQRHKSALTGQVVYMAFMIDGHLSKDPLGDMQKDFANAKYLTQDYPKALAMYFEKVRGIISSGKYDTDEGFKSSVLGKLGSLEHPSTILKSPIIGKGNVMLHNRGLEIKKGRAVKPVGTEAEYKKLADLCVQTYVKEFIFTWSMLNRIVAEDFFMTSAEVDKMLDLCEEYCKCLVNAMEVFQPLQKAMKGMADFAKKNIEIDRLDSTNQKAFKQTLKFVRGLRQYVRQPYLIEISRLQGIIIGSRVICSRTIATAK